MRRAALVLLAFVLTGAECGEQNATVQFRGDIDTCGIGSMEAILTDGESWLPFRHPEVMPGDCVRINYDRAAMLLAVRCPGAPLSESLIIRPVPGEGEAQCARWLP